MFSVGSETVDFGKNNGGLNSIFGSSVTCESKNQKLALNKVMY